MLADVGKGGYYFSGWSLWVCEYSLIEHFHNVICLFMRVKNILCHLYGSDTIHLFTTYYFDKHNALYM